VFQPAKYVPGSESDVALGSVIEVPITPTIGETVPLAPLEMNVIVPDETADHCA
jgi:hypothetical protein